MNKYKSIAFVSLASRFSIVFFVVVIPIKIIIGIFKLDGFENMKKAYLTGDALTEFLLQHFVMALIYGVALAGYYKYIKK